MASSILSTAPNNTTSDTAYAWMNPISAFMATAGWKQQADTGQIVWPASIVKITSVTWTGAVATYTYTLAQGAALATGQSIVITNCTTVGLNGTFIITGTPLSTTFTCANLTAAGGPEAETAVGAVNVFAAISSATGNGATATYNYTNTNGILKAGQSVVITLFVAQPGFNGTFTIKTLTATQFTVTNTTNASETVAAQGVVTAISCNTTKGAATLPPTNTNSIYEIWGMGDTLQATNPVILKILYTTGSATTTAPGLNVVLATATDGAGNITGGTTGVVNVLGIGSATFSASVFNSYIAGSTNRITLGTWLNSGLSGARGVLAVERSHDSTGADTASYVSLALYGQGNATPVTQYSVIASTQTTKETKLAVIGVTSTGTGSFGVSTLLSPVFPVVGAVGNPMINVLVGKSADWTDATQFSFTMYNTARNYLVVNNSGIAAAGQLTYDASITAALMMRFD